MPPPALTPVSHAYVIPYRTSDIYLRQKVLRSVVYVCWFVGSFVCSLVCSFVSSHTATACNGRRAESGSTCGIWVAWRASGGGGALRALFLVIVCKLVCYL